MSALKTKKKSTGTKYSAIGATIVPLAQQMRNSRENPSTPNKNAGSSENFFDDIMDWDKPENAAENKTNTFGIHKQDNDVSSSSPSLSFTPTPPPNSGFKLKNEPNSASQDRSVYILNTKSNPTTPIKTIPTAPTQIQENSSSLLDDIITEKPTQSAMNDITILTESDVLETNETVRNDPNYLPPPEENQQIANEHEDTQKDTTQHKEDEEEAKEEEEGHRGHPSPNINPWAHLNKTAAPNIMEAPIEDEEEPEDRQFLRHDTDDDFDVQKRFQNDNNNKSSVKKCCYFLMFVLGIAVGVLLTIALIRHQAIDANYLFNSPEMETETETDTVIQTEIHSINMNDNETTQHHMMHNRWNTHDSDDDRDILANVRGHNTPKPTRNPTQSPTVSPTIKPTQKPSISPTLKPTLKPTHSPSKKITLSPTLAPSTKVPTKSRILEVIERKASEDNPPSSKQSVHSDIASIVNITESEKNMKDSLRQEFKYIKEDIQRNDKEVIPQSSTQKPRMDDTDLKEKDKNVEIDSKPDGSEQIVHTEDDADIVDSSPHETNAKTKNDVILETESDATTPSPTPSQNSKDNTNPSNQSVNTESIKADVSEQITRREEDTDKAVSPQETTRKNHSDVILETEPDAATLSQNGTKNIESNVKIDTDIEPPISTPSEQHKSSSQTPSPITNQKASIPSPSTSDTEPLCDVVPQYQCTTNKHKPLPLPFDKPLSAQLRCHQNTCSSPPSLPGQTIISGETFEANKNILEIKHEIPIKCHTNDTETIKIQRIGYNNNEDWKSCIRITNDDTLQTYPILHITFALIDFGLEQGFDNLFLTTQSNEYYDDYAETWTGNWSILSKLEPNTWYQNFWMTSPKPNAFAEFCLRLQSDESNIGRGFMAQFTITREIGFWSEWTECRTHSARLSLGNDACGVGVRSRVSLCPNDIVSKHKQQNTNGDRFDWSNGTHSCIHEYSNYPLNKYCIVADCEYINNTKLAPIDQVEKHRKDGSLELWGKYIYNGASRIDPEYADPFSIIMNVERKGDELNLYKLREDLSSEIESILSRYSENSRALFPSVLNYAYPWHFSKLGIRLLSSLALGRVFTFVTTGSSNTAGHDNVFMSSYPMQLQSLMQTIWNKYSVYGGGFRVRNQAVGGHLGTVKQGPCVSALIGTYDKHIDMISWESFMNDGSHISPKYEEIWLRNILFTYNNSDWSPYITCISTGEGTQAGCLLTGRYVFNSFMRAYYNSTGVANYYGQHVCQASAICDDTDPDCLLRSDNDACRASHVSWHPSAHRHRVMAETFAVNFMRSAIAAIDMLYDEIETMDRLSSYELSCLLSSYVSSKDAFTRTLTEGVKCGTECSNAMWCAISFYPTPKHNQLHRFFVYNNGWFNNDTIDLPVDPLIMRNGGRAPCDHKAQWNCDIDNIGAQLQIMVKVPMRYIMIVYPQGTSRTNIIKYFAAFRFSVNNEEKQCEAVSYETGLNAFSFCLLDVAKPGKYVLTITLIHEIDDALKIKQYQIDEIAGI